VANEKVRLNTFLYVRIGVLLSKRL